MSGLPAVASVPLRQTEGVADRTFQRADIVLENVEQGGPSFELRVFLGNAEATQDTPRSPEVGYAGSVHVYGYGTPPPLPEGVTPGRVRSPMRREVDGTEAVQGWLRRGGDARVTLVAVPASGEPGEPFAVDLSAIEATLQLDPPGS